MSGSTFGHLFRLTTYGESHGVGLGGILDGCPSGIALCEGDIQKELDERRPGSDGRGGAASTARLEKDQVHLLSGVFEGKTTGTPIAFHVKNTDQHSSDYSALAALVRPGHADLGFHAKFGIRDPRGGGRSSARETVSRVAGGAIAKALLATFGICVTAYTTELGGIAAPLTDRAGAASRSFFAPDASIVRAWEDRIAEAKQQGDTLGGLVHVTVSGVPAGLGEPVFDKLDARLAYALMGIGSVKGVEIGNGFASARLTGSQNNDAFLPADTPLPEKGSYACGSLPSGSAYAFASNNAGGILGGMSSGASIELTVAVKPISSIAQQQHTITLDGTATTITVGGRHDISAIPRIVPVVRAMAALTVADFILLQRRQGALPNEA